ncbi:EndoU domain-containing protein [Mangrovivirga cuniculi]|nr:EndoU domain-containing protein [Mangrovivirga cuniculi]
MTESQTLHFIKSLKLSFGTLQTAGVEIYGKKGDGKGGWVDGWINKKSTFFPDSWSKSKIQAEVAHAFKTKEFDRLENGAEIFRGTGSDDSIIEIVIRGGIVKTAYPIIP